MARTGRDSIRRVRVPRDLVVSDAIRTQLRHWLKDQDRKDGDKLQLVEGMLKVVLTWHDRAQSRYSYTTSMPPEIRHISDNYVFRALEAKAKQLRNAHFRGIPCVIVAEQSPICAWSRADQMPTTTISLVPSVMTLLHASLRRRGALICRSDRAA